LNYLMSEITVYNEYLYVYKLVRRSFRQLQYRFMSE
jgi:hypothetical protein